MFTRKRTAQKPNVSPIGDPAATIEGKVDVEKRIGDGDRAFAEKKYEEALNCFLEAEKECPEDIKIITKLAMTYYKVRDYIKAIKKYNQAIEISPKDRDILYSLGMVYIRAGEKKSALAIYERLKKIHPEKAEKFYKEIYS